MDFFRRNKTRQLLDASSVKTSNLEDQASRTLPAKARHSVAVSSLGNLPNRYRTSDLSRQSGFPSSRSHIQLPNPQSRIHQHPPQLRSISASYSYRASKTGLPRSDTSFNFRGRPLSNLSESTPEKPRTRIQRMKEKVADKLNFSHLIDYPGDKWMELWEHVDLMDFGDMGYTLGFALNVVHFVIRILSAIEHARRSLVQNRGSRFGQTTNQFANDRLNEVRQLARKKYSLSWLSILSILSILMCLFSCYNAYKLFTSRKSYIMHIREDPVNSPNATIVQSPTAPDAAPQTWLQSFISLTKRLSSLLIGWPNPANSHVPKPSQVHQLDVWDPAEVRLRMFTLYPPPQSFLLHYASLTENCLNWSLVMVATIFQTYWIVKFYSQLVKDKAIIQSEVMHEYNAKFVYPKMFPHTREASTMTNSAEFIRREDWLSY